MSPPLKDEKWPEAIDALIAAPDHHTLLFENGVVRVLETRIPPGSRTPVHTHRWPGVLYVLSWSACVRRDAQDHVIMDRRMILHVAKPHQALWTPPLTAHSLENVGEIELRVISMELKQTAS
jgi:quercetin dioxygenase-like cupin family protein